MIAVFRCGRIFVERKWQTYDCSAKRVRVDGVDLDRFCEMYSATGDSSEPTVQSFRGRWDLTLKTPLREYPSRLGRTREDGQFKVQMVSPWGHARPLPKVEISNDHITFVSPKEEEDRKDDMVFEGKLSGNAMVGTTTGPDGSQCNGLE